MTGVHLLELTCVDYQDTSRQQACTDALGRCTLKLRGTNRPASTAARGADAHTLAPSYLRQSLLIDDVSIAKVVTCNETNVWRVELTCWHTPLAQVTCENAGGHALAKRHQAVTCTSSEVLCTAAGTHEGHMYSYEHKPRCKLEFAGLLAQYQQLLTPPSPRGTCASACTHA